MRYPAIVHRSAWILLAAALLAACSSIPREQRDKEELDRYTQYAGPPLESFTYLGHYTGWQSLSRYQLVVWTGINEAYLITVFPPCEDLQFANRIGLTSTGHTVYRNFDRVIVRHWKCQIKEIRPVNYLQMKQDMRQQHEQEKARQTGDKSTGGSTSQ